MDAETYVRQIHSDLLDVLAPEKFLVPPSASPAQPGRSQALAEDLIGALENPCHYPPLGQSVFPGDRVAIALQTGLAHDLELVTSLVEQLIGHGIEPADISVVVSGLQARQLGFSQSETEDGSPSDALNNAVGCFKQIGGRDIHFQIHHADSASHLAYLAANEAGDPMHVNRVLVDADVIVPVGYPDPGAASNHDDCLYPTFAATAVQERFNSREITTADRAAEVELANDTLGSFYAIQVVTGPGNRVHQIVAGSRKDVLATARSACRELWEIDSVEMKPMVVATIETTFGEPQWNDFLRAVLNASRISDANAPIVVWTNLSRRPDRQFRSAFQSQFEESVNPKLSVELQHLVAVLQERRVYLRSELSQDVVETLGLGFVSSVSDIYRLSENVSGSWLLRDAHRFQVRENPQAVV